jgi:hypothetical protein
MEVKERFEFLLKEVVKSTDNVKIPQSIYDELAYLRKTIITETGIDGSFLVVVIKKGNVITDDLEIVGKLAPVQIETANVILKQAIEAVKGNGDDKGKVKVRYVAKL